MDIKTLSELSPASISMSFAAFMVYIGPPFDELGACG